jgi:DNA-binding IclR family transcriptional regulator
MPTNNYINVIERTADVLGAFGSRRDVALKDLAQRSGIVKSSVFRILFTLEKLGYVSKSADSLYSIEPKFLALVTPAPLATDLINAAAPYMQSLVDRFKETVNLGLLEGNEVVYIYVIESPHMLRQVAYAGIRSALHTSAMGKCLTAYIPPDEIERLVKTSFKRMTPRTITTKERFFQELEETRKRGFAIDNAEESVGTRCVGVPIFDQYGRPAAALSISGPESRFREQTFQIVAEALQAASKGISRLLKHKRTQPQPRER